MFNTLGARVVIGFVLVGLFFSFIIPIIMNVGQETANMIVSGEPANYSKAVGDFTGARSFSDSGRFN